MPPLSDYTPFESLLFFQSLAALDAHPASFGKISDVLRSNPFIRHHVAFNPDRLTPEALEDLYTTLIRDGLDSAQTASEPNGHIADSPGSSNPKKRKIASPRPDGLGDKSRAQVRMVPDFVSHLYAKYKELVTREIKNEETRYRDIRDEINRLQEDERQVAESAPAPSVSKKTNAEPVSVPVPEPMDVDVKEEKPLQQPMQSTPSVARQPTAAQQRKEVIPPQQPPQPVPPARAQEQQPSLIPPVVQSPAPTGPPQLSKQPLQPQPQPLHGKPPLAPQKANFAPRNASATPVVNTPAAPGTPAMPVSQPPKGASVPVSSPAPPLVPTTKTGAAKGGPPIAAPPAQSSFQQWTLNPSPQTPHPPIPSQGIPPHPGQAGTERPIPSPFAPVVAKSETERASQGPSAPSGPFTPGSVAGLSPAPLQDYHTPIGAAQALFSESRASRPRLSIDTPGSATPWKRTPRLSLPHSPGSPPRPRPEDVSPISDRAPSPMELPEPTLERPGSRRGKRRPASKGKAAPTTEPDKKVVKTEKATTRRTRAASTTSSRSRGRSVLSRDEEWPAEHHGRIKHEMPTTPAGVSEVTESKPEDRPGRGRPKRKRVASEAPEPEPLPSELGRFDSSQCVMCTRNFPRTGAPIMNDVTMHKHASIFTKPLTERDAPGYRDLIYRPQDLKSIKSSIHAGSKGVAAATEAANTPAADGESPAPTAGASSSSSSKNAVLVLQKTEDIIPPKGIVNSAQLEKELIRMFANAIMFNPIPQRGFGPSFPMISEGGGSRESTVVPDSDEGGIIKDTQEMFDDVEKAVTRWRAAERTTDDVANKSVLSLRRGSASDFNTDSADEVRG